MGSGVSGFPGSVVVLGDGRCVAAGGEEPNRRLGRLWGREALSGEVGEVSSCGREAGGGVGAVEEPHREEAKVAGPDGGAR